MIAPLPPTEQDRLKALLRYEILDTVPEPEFDDISLLASHICGTPISLISLVDGNRQWFKSKVGLTVSETSRDIAFCAHTILQTDVFVVEDALADPRFASNPLVTGAAGIRFYAGAPLVTSDGFALGSLCVIDQVPHTLSPPQMAALRALSRQVIAQLELKRNLVELQKRDEALRLFQSAVEQSKESILITAADLDLPGPTIVFVNSAFAKMTGYTAEEAIGQTPRMLQGPRTDKAVLHRLRQNLANGEVFAGEAINYRKDGTEFDLEWQVAPLRDRVGKITHFLAIQRDVTERKKAEAVRDHLAARAEAANRAKSEFLANMSHEIRTPMNGVLGMTELVLDSALTPEQRGYLEMANSSAEALLGLINDILDFSKIEAGKLELEAIPFNLRESVTHLLRPLVFRAGKKRVELLSEIAPEIPEQVVGDPLRLRQILLNFTDNAIKFTKQGTITVKVTAEGNTAGEQCLHFAVTDTGIGIPAEKQEAIFEAFAQLDGSTTRHYGGTGLGLAIASRLVQQMGGKVWIESQVGKGTTFHFTARFGVAGEAAAAEHTPAEPSASARGLAHSKAPAGLRILLAEDNVINRALATALLEKRGHSLVHAVNGREAVEAAARETFDLIFMDVQMPEMDGLEATQRIRELEAPLGRHTPIVAMTAHAMAGDRERCLAAGMDDYLSKPLQKAELLALLERVRAAHAPVADEPLPPTRALPIFSRTKLLEQLDGNEALLLRLIALFQENTPRLLDDIRECIARRGSGDLARSAHALLGSFGAFGANAARRLTQQLEAQAHAENYEHTARTFAALERETAEVHAALSAFAPARI